MEERTRPAPPHLPARARAAAPEWCLTLVFHPLAARIGTQACFPCGGEAWGLGRLRPIYCDPFDASNSGSDLADPRISRCALNVEPLANGWKLVRPPGSSRVRVDGSELTNDLALDEGRLRAGVLLTLANTVLIHLRLRETLGPEVCAARPAERMAGVSAPMRILYRDLAQAAASDADVLLLGPTGAGKDLAARAIHGASRRRRGPWVAVNMAALAPDLAAASLFGVRRGAYTGADRHRPGFFRQAAGGTLFLDEIADTPGSLQALLLRALQDRELQVVGGGVEAVDLRVIAATERDVDGADGSFRSALRYRLGGVELRLPALAERREDIAVIAAEALRAGREAVPWERDGCSEEQFARWVGLFEALLLRDWPGNVRELLHRVARLAADDSATLADAAPGGVSTQVAEPRPRRLADLSDDEFRAAWEACGYEVARMARFCGVSRQAVYRRLQSLADCRLAADVPLRELLAALRQCRGDLLATAQCLAVSPSGLRGRLRASGMHGVPPHAAPRDG